MPSSRQQDAFSEAILNLRNLLDDAIEWIKSNLGPADVFDEDDLLTWAAEQHPEEIFDEGTLSSWAENNGFVPEA
jgi:hypothetical protein